MKKLLQIVAFLSISHCTLAEEAAPIVLWGIYEADVSNIEIDADSTWAHSSTYSFRITDGNPDIRKVFVSSFVMEGTKDPWKKMKGIEFGTKVQISISRKYKGEQIPITPENGILYIYSDEFKILKKERVNQSLQTTRAKRPLLANQQDSLNPETCSTAHLSPRV